MEPYIGGMGLCIDTAWEEDGDLLFRLDSSEKDNPKQEGNEKMMRQAQEETTKTSKRSKIMMKASMRGNKKRHEQDDEGDDK